MTKMWGRVIFPKGFDEFIMNDISEEWEESEYFFGDYFIRFHGSQERWEEFVKACKEINKDVIVKLL